jgi:hypothetical protein
VRPTQRFDLTVALDYGQFSLTGAYLPVGGDADPVRLVDEAIHGAGIAGSVGNEQVGWRPGSGVIDGRGSFIGAG